MSNVHFGRRRMWDCSTAPDRWITLSSVRRFSDVGIRGVPRVVVGRLAARYLRTRSARADRRAASSDASQASLAISSTWTTSMRRSIPVSYPPTTTGCRTVCHGMSDTPTTSAVERLRDQEKTACTGRTDGWEYLLTKKAVLPSSVVLRRGWVPWGLSILSP